MNDYFNRVDSDLAQMLAARGQTFQIGAVTLACAINRPAAGDQPVEGGMWDEYSGVVLTRLVLLTGADPVIPIPVEGDQITVDGKLVYVGKVKSNSTTPLLTIPFQNEPLPR